MMYNSAVDFANPRNICMKTSVKQHLGSISSALP